jgi:hypothetical protein
MVVALLIAAPQQTLHAATVTSGQQVWSENLKKATGDEIVTHPDGSVTTTNCSGDSAMTTETFSALGVSTGSLAQKRGYFCDFKVVDGAGTVFGLNRNVSPPSIVAYRGPQKLWERRLEACGAKLKPAQFVLGVNGALYVLTEKGGCASDTYLAKLTTSTGEGKSIATNHQVRWIAAYRNGIAGLSSNAIDFFGYDGVSVSSTEFKETVGYRPIGSTIDGRVFLSIIKKPAPESNDCGDSSERPRAIVGYGPAGKVFNYELLPCSELMASVVTSKGGIVLITRDDKKEFSVRSLKPNGEAYREQLLLANLDSGRVFPLSKPAITLIADTRGNVVLSRRYRFTYGTDSRDGLKFEVLTPSTLQTKAMFRTDTIDPTATFEASSESIGLAPGTLYFAASKCSAESCSTRSSRMLYAVQLPVAMDSPRGEILAGQVSATPSPCPSLLFAGVRGSGETTTDHDGFGKTVADVKSRLAKRFPKMEAHAIDYPAVPVLYKAGAYDAAYNKSVKEGRAVLKAFLNLVASKCPKTRYIGVGYSQGAHVVGDIFGDLKSATWQKRVAAVVLFGDPRFNPKQTVVNEGTYERKLSGIYKFQPARQTPPTLTNRTKSYCIRGDAVCSYSLGNFSSCASSPSTCPHSRYVATWTKKVVAWLRVSPES